MNQLLFNGNRIEDCRKTFPILSRNEKSLATFPIRQKRSFPLEMTKEILCNIVVFENILRIVVINLSPNPAITVAQAAVSSALAACLFFGSRRIGKIKQNPRSQHPARIIYFVLILFGSLLIIST
ncbi:unnamed protein product [Euphydryas editha]|uniref:Uncharacterized protein n=1 Tax=Euphydryas editha TaxID=104508 RepID=A0AAU9UZ61_EUPED|nr:unnamed protein product [Euphydryas editha]